VTARNPSRSPLTTFIAARGLPTLMLAVAANATTTPAPASHRRWANGFSRLAFRYPARAMGVAGCRMVFVPADRSGWRMILARGRQEKMVN